MLRPTRGLVSPEWRQLWAHRELLLTLGQRDIMLRYKQTLLGVAWVVLQPLIATVVLTFVFDRVAGLQSPGQLPYALLTFSGMVAWNVFHGALTRSSRSLVADAHLVSKVYFPRLVLPLSTIGSVLVDFVVAFGVLLALLLLWGHPPTWTILFVPVPLFGLVLLALGLGLAAGALAVHYRDVQHMVPLSIQLLFYASPVAYWTGVVPDEYRELYELNPIVGLLEGFRWATLGICAVDAWVIVYAFAVASISFVGGVFLFRNLERKFADVI